MNYLEIFTENSDAEQWQMLRHFSYPVNIQKYFNKKFNHSLNQDKIESTSGSISQAEEYYKAGDSSSLNISPLLYYYGTTNLLFGITSLIKDEDINIKDHGMKLLIPKGMNKIADLQIQILNPERGAFGAYNKVFNEDGYNPNGEKWSLLEILGSIPELKDDFESCYQEACPYIIPLQKIKKNDDYLFRIEKSKISRFENISDIFSQIRYYSDNFLSPQILQNHPYIVLRKKLNGSDISFRSISGQRYINISHEKGNRLVNLPLVLFLFMSLYCLGFLSRYHPEIWTPFIRNDTTGEKQIFEKLIKISKRYIPNLMLDYLYETEIRFVRESQGTIDFSQSNLKEELVDFIKEEIKNNIGNLNMSRRP